MQIRKLLAAAALAAMPITFAPATAQTGDDPVYECIVGCVASRPNSGDWCVQECNRRFGGEQRPNPGTPNLPCNPNRPFGGCPTQ